ncbi:DUF3488 and transglutaminase-like domain-containing protein [uncultured Cellulomonas sp.]|uniref:transglutaminase TgpA family protein n=1 Tax=uncultured Cellulomonas sp. TaxID=189682 RepID=UPI002632C9DA|nr:DUF3488 and transglutaminase-like domain-containing protein [uncultured Cellulomonas sp.]
MRDVPSNPLARLAGGLCVGAVTASLFALGHLIAPGRWLGAGIVALLGLGVVLMTVRACTRAWWAPTLVGALVVMAGLLVAYGGPPGRLQVLPDREAVARLGDLLRAGLDAAQASAPPAEATIPLEVLVVGGALLVLLTVDLLAVGLGAPAWSGLALLGLWVPPLVIGRPTGTPAFIGAALAYLLLLAVAAAPGRPAHRNRGAGERRRRVTAALPIAGTVTVVALLIGPVGAVLPGWSSVPLPYLGSAAGGPVQLADDLDMRRSLGARSSEIVLTYRADPVPAGPLRVFTLRDYDGRRWVPEDPPRGEVPTAEPGAVLWPARDLTPEPPGEGAPTVTRLEVRVEGLREDRLPVPVMPRTVQVSGGISYDAGRDEVVRPVPTSAGLEYSMEVQLLDLTADTLRTSRTADPGDVADYLQLPRTARADDLRARAQEIVAGAEGRYERALALQSYFRSAQNFTYATEVDPARTNDAVWDFLESGRGYCVQFATAMTVMARSLGIPARLAVGFLPGRQDDEGVYVVTGRDSHAWPELYFADVGWVRFEPTPAVQSGAPPRWADPFLNSGAPTAEEVQPPAAPATPPPATEPLLQPEDAPATADSGGWVGTVAVGAALLLVIASAVFVRRRLTVTEEMQPEVAWAHLRRRLAGSGITWTDAHTPRQVAAEIAAQLQARHGRPISPDARSALTDLARAVEDHRYAPAPRARVPADHEQQVAMILREATLKTPARQS